MNQLRAREILIDALVENEAYVEDEEGDDLLCKLLREGFKGFGNMTIPALIEEVRTLGLQESDEEVQEAIETLADAPERLGLEEDAKPATSLPGVFCGACEGFTGYKQHATGTYEVGGVLFHRRCKTVGTWGDGPTILPHERKP